jgi:hypothetical protein
MERRKNPNGMMTFSRKEKEDIKKKKIRKKNRLQLQFRRAFCLFVLLFSLEHDVIIYCMRKMKQNHTTYSISALNMKSKNNFWNKIE